MVTPRTQARVVVWISGQGGRGGQKNPQVMRTFLMDGPLDCEPNIWSDDGFGGEVYAANPNYRSRLCNV